MKKTLKQSIGRRLAALLLAMLMLVSIMPVGMAALEPGSTVSVKGEWIQGFYQDFRGSGLPGSFGTSWGQHERFTTNGQISYCVQKGAEHTNGNQSVSDVYASFSKAQQDMIKIALIYLYNGTPRYGYNADIETVASQAIVWAIQGGFLTANATTEKTFLDCSFSTKGGTSAANKANCIAVYNKIKEQILNHEVLPSFCSKSLLNVPTHTLKYNSSTGKYEAVLTDTNNVLPYFTGSISGVTFTKNGNQLTISSNAPINGDVQVKLEKTISKYLPKLIYRDPLYLTSSNSQNKVTTALGTADPLPAYMKLVTQALGQFTVNKVDQDGKALAGSGFTLYKDSAVVGAEKKGGTSYTWAGLVPGNYTIKETTIPAGYKKGADVAFTVDADGLINGSPSASQNVSNTLITGQFTINKVDETGKALAGSGFTLYKDGAAVGAEKKGGTSYTWDNLLPGTYTVKETTVPSGAVKAEDITFIVAADGTVNGSANYSTNVVNIAQVGRIILSKTDAGTGLPLTGWIFEVRRVSDNVLMDTIISTNDSTVQSAELPLGDYYLVEKQAPYGYLLDPTYHIVNLTYGSPTERVVYTSQTVGDENAMGRIKVQKTGEVLTGVKVTPIQEAEDSYSIAGIIPSEFNYHAKINLLNADNAVVDTCTVDENGAFVFTGIPEGDYTLILEYKAELETTKPEETTTAIPEETTTAAETTAQATTAAETQPETSIVTVEQFLSHAPQGKAEDVKTVSVSINVNADTVGNQNSFIGTITLQLEQKEPVDSEKLYTPVYSKRGIPGCVFNIITDENIKTPDGTLRYAKDTIVDTVTSSANGTVLSKELYLGKYRVEEIGVVPGFTINKTPVSVTLKYKDQVTPVVMETAAVDNLRQKVQFGLYKESEIIELGETNADGITELLSTFKPSEGVVFTIHAAENILDVNGNVVIPKDGIVDIVITDSSGKTQTTKDLPLAAYYAKELYNSVEYVIDGTKYTVDVAETATGDITTETFILDFNNGETIVNRLIRGQIQVVKKDAGTGEPLAGAQYLVTNADGVIVDKLITGEDGTATTINLPYGIYTVTEIKPPEGYQLAGAQDAAQTADINADGAVIELNYKNKPTEVILHKTDITSAEGLLGAQITIYNEAGEIVARGITDSDGQFIIYNLPAGKYTFEETAAPIGYQLNTTVFQFEINQNGNVTGDDTVTDRPTEVVIHKTDATNAAGLPGAEITVYDKDGNVVFSGITNENGSVTILNLPAGTYTFKETGAPAGYQINTTVFTFTIHEDGTVTGDNTVTDKPTEVIFHKTDANGKPLANAEITVFDKDGNAVTSGLTDENGIFTVYGLPAGEYTYRETTAPAGYLLNDTVYSFTIQPDGSVTEIKTIINQSIPVSDNPNTGDTAQTAGLLATCAASFLLMGGMLLMGRKKKRIH